jgi:hypothetical protein
LADAKYPEHCMKVIKEKDYWPQQVFNFGETRLFWKKIPTHTFVSKIGKISSFYNFRGLCHCSLLL